MNMLGAVKKKALETAMSTAEDTFSASCPWYIKKAYNSYADAKKQLKEMAWDGCDQAAWCTLHRNTWAHVRVHEQSAGIDVPAVRWIILIRETVRSSATFQWHRNEPVPRWKKKNVKIHRHIWTYFRKQKNEHIEKKHHKIFETTPTKPKVHEHPENVEILKLEI